MRFAEIVGQEKPKSQLVHMWQQNHLPHALLMLGPEGVGGFVIAWALAQFVLCQNRQAQDSCGVCPNCQKISKLEHPDLHFSFPTYRAQSGKPILSTQFLKEFKSYIKENPYNSYYEWLQYIHAENKQGTISADECNAIIEKLSLKSYEGGYKIMIIWCAEQLGREGNRLLKLIEEPPAQTIIILVASAQEHILATILSRVQSILLAPISTDTISGTLTQQFGLDKAKAQQLALLSEGSYLKVLQLMDNEEESDFFPLAKNWFNCLFTNDGVGLVKFIDDFAKRGREQQKKFLEYVNHLIEAAIKFRYTSVCHLVQEEMYFVEKLARMNIPVYTLKALTEHTQQTQELIQRNANAKIQIHAASVKMMHAIRNKKVSSLR